MRRRRQEGGADNWGEWMRIAPTNLPGSSRFGYAVALQGDLLAVGAPGAGAVFLFQRHHGGSNAWGEILRWSPSGAGANGADFGWSVALSDSTLIVGAPKFNGNTATTGCEGRVFHFQRDEGGSGALGLRKRAQRPTGRQRTTTPVGSGNWAMTSTSTGSPSGEMVSGM